MNIEQKAAERSIGKLRGLQQISSRRGTFTCLALDHRQNLRRAMNPANPEGVSDEELSGFKVGVAAAIGDAATAVLLDPEYSAAQAVAAGAISAQTGLVVAVESTGYTGDPTARQSQVLPGWSVTKACRMGASVVKLLVYYHPDSPAARKIQDFVRQVAEDCIQNDMALMLEPLSYSLDPDRKLTSEERRRVVVETARRLTPLGVDILKAEFPLAAEASPEEWGMACNELCQASQVPWILLSGAVDFETYLQQTAIACQAGASGIAVGRAVWQEAVAMPELERQDFLLRIARPRLERLTSLCTALARPWTEFFSSPAIRSTWYQEY